MSAPVIKLKIRTVKNAIADIEIATDKTIADVKKSIETTYKHSVASQRLIFTGKVLEDDKTVASYNIQPDKLIVLYVKEPAAAPAPATTPATSTTTASQPPATPTQPTTTARPVATTPASPSPAAQPQPAAAPAQPVGPVNNTTLSAEEFAAAVQNMVDMGFDRAQSTRALNAAYGDSARAVEYVISGNIPNINNERRAPPPVAAAQGGNGSGAAPAQGAPVGNSPLAALRQLPQFQGLIALIQQNPAYLEPLLAQLAERDPSIVDLIRDNREEFLQILQQPVDPNILAQLQMPGEEEGEEYGEEGEEDVGMPGIQPGAAQGGATVIHITPAENEAVNRLVALGFDRNRALEAFLVCNKDEEMAANYLFEQGDM